ncbi:MAG: hypothetical protein BGO21_05255 [Dyadobacter sp. 50-39]|uniref:hypothetical protein n=1 Tax=Dyadobacter sp. 50-39 TaxID=1895756 RepID=UPI00095C1C58|nr:hypothetical protein [Dyadobacter sp. 50-39]OJV22566.1 MAG: hypothetical protein BGO21_05255 [Dyadobacter sp. 50-39]
MNLIKRALTPLSLLLTLLLIQCKDSGNQLTPNQENELITSVTLHFKPVGSDSVLSFYYKDPDGDGGNAPIRFDTIRLKVNEKYAITAEFFDESKTPAIDITQDIRQNANDHLLVFTASPASLLSYQYGDQDGNHYPIGLIGTVSSGVAGLGKLKVQLRHQPNQKDGTPAPGSDDVNLDFNIKVQ